MKYLLLLLVMSFIGCKNTNEDDRRYFFVSYNINNGVENFSGNLFSDGSLKNYDEWEEIIRKEWSCMGYKYTLNDIVIVGIYEFKDSLEYNNFKSGYYTPYPDCKEDSIPKTTAITLTTDSTSGLDYEWEQISGPKLAEKDTKIKSVWTDGVRLSPKSSKLLDRDTIYIYRDTCTLRGIASFMAGMGWDMPPSIIWNDTLYTRQDVRWVIDTTILKSKQ